MEESGTRGGDRASDLDPRTSFTRYVVMFDVVFVALIESAGCDLDFEPWRLDLG